VRGVNLKSDYRSEIESQYQGFIAAIKRGDAAGVAAFYTEGARFLPPNSEILSGRQAIQAYWQDGLDRGVKDVKYETVELTNMGDDNVCEIGEITVKIPQEGGGAATYNGKYVVIWKLEGGSWKLDTDIWNSSMPVT